MTTDEITPADAGWRLLFASVVQWSVVAEFHRSA